MKLTSRSGGSCCVLTLYEMGSGSLMAKVRVSKLGLRGVTGLMPIDHTAVEQFIAELDELTQHQLGDVSLHCVSQVDAASVQVYTLDRARHLGVQVRVKRSQYLQSQYSENHLDVTFELDPSRLPAAIRAFAEEIRTGRAPITITRCPFCNGRGP